MPRPWSPAVRRVIEAEASEEALIVVADITHADLAQPIRVVSDTVDYTIDGERYYGAPFDVQLVSDGEGPPEARISVQNVDRRVGLSVEGLTTSPVVRFRVMSTRDFDTSVLPRVPTGTPEVIYEADDLELRDMEISAFEVSATLMLRDYGQEPWPYRRVTPDRFPGLFLG